MRILQINAVYATSSTGRNVREMHEYCLKHGIESYVAAPDLAGLRNHCYKIGNIIDYKIHALLTRIYGKQAYFSTFSTKRFLKYIDKLRPDIVVLHNLHGNYINLSLLLKYLAQRNISTVAVLHDSWFITGGCTYYISSGCEKWKTTCGNCPVIHTEFNTAWIDKTTSILQDRERLFGAIPRLSLVGVSQWVTNDAKQSVISGNTFKIQCIYNWIDLELFKPKNKIELRRKYDLPEDKFIVLGVSATWSVVKGINLFHSLADILLDSQQIVLVGDSSLLEDKRNNIIYLPPTDNIYQLADLYALADVFVNPTIQETFGKTTAEALSCGVPVVAYQGTATPELVGTDGKCGHLCKDINVKSFAERINRIYKDGSSTYSETCRSRAEELFSMEKNLNKYIELFEEMIASV